MRQATLIAGLLAAMMIMPLSAEAQGKHRAPKARVRVMNAVPGLTDINLRLNRDSTFYKVPYGVCTSYVNVTEGGYLMDVTTIVGQTTIIPPTDVMFYSGIDYTALVSGSVSGDPELDAPLIELPRLRVPRNQAHLVFVNAAPDVCDADFLVNGNLESAFLWFRDYDGPIPFPPGQHSIEAIGSGPLLAGPTTYRFQGGTTTLVVLRGTKDPTDGYPLIISFHTAR